MKLKQGQAKSSSPQGVKTVGNDQFEEFMSDQIDEIKTFREELEQELGRDVSIDEAARRWIQQYAERYRETYRQEKKAS